MYIVKRVSVLFLILAQIILFPAGSGAADGQAAAGARPQGDVQGAQSGSQDKIPPIKPPVLQMGEWEPLFEMGQTIYPSVVISTSTMQVGLWDDDDHTHLGDQWGLIGVAVRGTKPNCPVEVEISGGNFIKPSRFTGELADVNTVYCVYPDLKYDYEKLLAVKQTIPEMVSFKVTVGGHAYPEESAHVQVRPVNECVYNFTDSSGVTNDVSYFFAAFVNENHPFISQVLKEAIASRSVSHFSGYSGDSESVKEEIEAIWDTLQKHDLHYCSMTASADDDDPYISSQYVRLLGESIYYAQANCVDGSVLMASIFRKIGLNASLIEVPGHMFVAVDLDEEGKEMLCIETTMLGESTFDEAVEAGQAEFEKYKNAFDSKKEEDAACNIVNIQNAREMGIMPIKDASVQ